MFQPTCAVRGQVIAVGLDIMRAVAELDIYTLYISSGYNLYQIYTSYMLYNIESLDV
jgi:hypothetical protein